MKSYIPLLISLAISISASPTPIEKRQKIDSAAYNAVPAANAAAAPVGDAPPASYNYQGAAVANAAAAAAAATGSTAVVMASQTTATPTPSPSSNDCQPRSLGSGPTVSPDTADAFSNYPQFLADSKNAQVPVGYTRILTGSNLAAQDPTYMTYTLMSSYDTAGCAAMCQAKQGCNSFNLYYERASSLTPGPSCVDPASTTYIKCVFFGGVLTAASAKNSGGSEYSFKTVIAGSDLYTISAPAPVTGYVGPISFGNAAIDAPSGYMGVQVFPQTQPYDPSVCAAACNQKTTFDLAQGIPNKANPDICNFFVAYILYKNGDAGVFTCSFYNSAWDSSYATEVGQYDGAGNHYTIGSSNGYALPSAPQNGKTTFALQISGTGDNNDNTYLYQPGTNNLAIGRATPYQFTLSPTGLLLADATGSTGAASITARGGSGGYNIFFGKNFQALVCSKGSGMLMCSVGASTSTVRNLFEYCPASGSLGISNVVDDGCRQVVLKVV